MLLSIPFLIATFCVYGESLTYDIFLLKNIKKKLILLNFLKNFFNKNLKYFSPTAFIPELRNLHGKCLMCYVFSLMILYLGLSAVQIDLSIMKVESFGCQFIGYAIYMSVLLCFFWLNVMCYDIWSTFK